MKRDKRRRRGDEFISVNKPERVWRGGPGYEKHRDGRGGEGAEIFGETERASTNEKEKADTQAFNKMSLLPSCLPVNLRQ